MSERTLATIQKVLNLIPIEGADFIELAQIMGWQCVVKKGIFKPGDLGVYCEVDSWLPVDPKYEFLRKNCYKKNELGEGFRIKTIRLKKILSQGLFLPLSDFPELFNMNVIGTDVTEILNIKKYDIPIPAQLAGTVRSTFPSFVPKTDEIRIQSVPEYIEYLKDREVYWSIKCDGTSSTFINHLDDFHVCSRNMSLKELEENVYWKMFHKHDIKSKLDPSYSIQGEICGPGIQKNRMGLSELQFFLFNVYDISNSRYLDFYELKDFSKDKNIPMVPIERVEVFKHSMEDVIRIGTTCCYPNGKSGEGYVIRPTVHNKNERLSCKIINNNYLLEHGE